jgi:hypothetical protein
LATAKAVYWTYNIEKHYEADHPTRTPPPQISDEEIAYLKSYKN